MSKDKTCASVAQEAQVSAPENASPIMDASQEPCKLSQEELKTLFNERRETYHARHKELCQQAKRLKTQYKNENRNIQRQIKQLTADFHQENAELMEKFAPESELDRLTRNRRYDSFKLRHVLIEFLSNFYSKTLDVNNSVCNFNMEEDKTVFSISINFKSEEE